MVILRCDRCGRDDTVVGVVVERLSETEALYEDGKIEELCRGCVKAVRCFAVNLAQPLTKNATLAGDIPAASIEICNVGFAWREAPDGCGSVHRYTYYRRDSDKLGWRLQLLSDGTVVDEGLLRADEWRFAPREEEVDCGN